MRRRSGPDSTGRSPRGRYQQGSPQGATRMDRRRLIPAALALAVATLSACGRAPEPTAATPPPEPAVIPAPAPMPPPAPVPGLAIPARFQGEWNRVLADCGTGNNDTRLRLDAGKVTFHESSGPVV